MSVIRQTITPFIWFDSQAEAAANLYVSAFKNSRIQKVVRSPAGAPGAAGAVMTVAFELDGLSFVGLNGGPHVSLNQGVSFVINCETQSDVDHYWERLGQQGRYMQCGWLTDQFGVTWQVVPTALPELLSSGDAAVAQRVMQTMMQMVKLDVAALRKAAQG
jgi:predicted 3-demethylubiquinone-9 3-methyltransferase (glyoxalase superfamily)